MDGDLMSGDAMRLDRDRYVAFAFAGADILFELDADGSILFSAGALSLIGASTGDVAGKSILDLIADEDRPFAEQIFESTAADERSVMKLLHFRTKSADTLPFIVSCCCLRDFEGHFFVALTRAAAHAAGDVARLAVRDPRSGAITRERFSTVAVEKLRTGREFASPCHLSLIELGGFVGLEMRAPEDEVTGYLRSSVDRLRARAIDGESIGMLGSGKICVIHDPGTSLDGVVKWIDRRAREMDPTGTGLAVSHKAVSLDAGGLIDADALAALMHVLGVFANDPGVPDFASLNASHDALLLDEMERINAFRCTVLAGSLAVAFQPVVRLSDRHLDHFEALARFNTFTETDSPAEHLDFAENTGLISEFDYAMANNVIELLHSFEHVPGVPTVAINLSARSLVDRRFMRSLSHLLGRYQRVARQIRFEVTDSCDLVNLEPVNTALQELRRSGAQVGLDDFGVGGADLEVLRRLDVDYVKIDGRYVESILETPRAQSFLKAITGLCNDLGIGTVAKSVETETTHAFLTENGVGFGQGYLFGKPRLATSVLLAHEQNGPEALNQPLDWADEPDEDDEDEEDYDDEDYDDEDNDADEGGVEDLVQVANENEEADV